MKADDLLDRLIASAKNEVDGRHPATDAKPSALTIATQIAVGALRYFMLKFTKSSVIAFDFKEALSFEGETGPYAQYAAVRAANIFRKGGFDPDEFGRRASDRFCHDRNTYRAKRATKSGNFGWRRRRLPKSSTRCIATTEPAYLAKHAFQLAQLFNIFYHRHPILSEPDPQQKEFLLVSTAVVRRELIRVLGLMGITVPSVM